MVLSPSYTSFHKQHRLVISHTCFTAEAPDPDVAAPVVAMSRTGSRSLSAGSLHSLAALSIVVDPSSLDSATPITSTAIVPSDPRAAYHISRWDATGTMDFDTGSMDPSPPSANGSHTPLDMNLTGDNATELDMSMFTNHTAGEDDQVEVPSGGFLYRTPPMLLLTVVQQARLGLSCHKCRLSRQPKQLLPRRPPALRAPMTCSAQRRV